MPSYVEDPCRATPRVHAAPNRGSMPRYVKPYTVWPGPNTYNIRNPSESSLETFKLIKCNQKMSVTSVPDRGGAHYFFGFFFCFTDLRMIFGYQFSCLDDVFWLLFAGIMALAKQFSLPNLGFWFLWCGRRNPWTPRSGRKKTRQSFPLCGRKISVVATESSLVAV